MTVVLTICVPTHEGRARTIGDTLASVAEQLTPAHRGLVTVAVRDNASQDGTAEVVAAAAAAGLPVSYERNPENVGYARNLDRVIEQADGEWCWFVSSDDKLMPGAIDRVLGLLAAHPDVGGIAFNQLVLDRDLRHAPWQQSTPAAPPLDEVTVLRTVDDVVGEVGWMMSGISSQLVRRRGWIDAGAPLRATPEHAGSWFPHVAIPLRMAASGSAWLWCPEKLVAIRSGNVDAVLDRGPRLQGELLMHLDDTWGAAVGHSPGRAQARHRYRVGMEALGLFEQLRGDRERRPRDSAWLLWTFARAFGREPAFWFRDAWRLVVPADVARPRWSRRGGPPPIPADPVPAHPASAPDAADAPAPTATLTAELPRRARRADMLDLPCRVVNAGAAELPASLALRCRWTAPDGTALDTAPVPLDRPLPPGTGRTLRVRTNAPLPTGDWELRLALRADGGWDASRGDAVGTVAVRP